MNQPASNAPADLAPASEPESRLLGGVRKFMRMESASGIVLLGVLAVTVAVANSPWSDIYNRVLDNEITVQIENVVKLEKPMVLWVNQGLMAVFFLLIAAEVKREVIAGELRSLSRVAAPVAAGLAGMAVPMGVYLLVTWMSSGAAGFDPLAWRGWPIPMATDIAFTMGVVTLLGRHVPPALKVFLMTLSIVDDIGSALVISILYSTDLSTTSLSGAGACLVVLLLLNLSRVKRLAPYVLVGVVFWVFVINSGMTATVAGMAMGLAIPFRGKGGATDLEGSPLRRIETSLHPWVAFLILPLFVFGNGGIVFAGITRAELTSPVMLGVLLGMVLGKQAGVFAMTWALVKLRIAKLPTGVGWRQLYGLSCLTGVGFTMSLFIGSVAFIPSPFENDMRMGVLGGSLISAVWGSIVLIFFARPKAPAAAPAVPSPDPPPSPSPAAPTAEPEAMAEDAEDVEDVGDDRAEDPDLHAAPPRSEPASVEVEVEPDAGERLEVSHEAEDTIEDELFDDTAPDDDAPRDKPSG